MSFSSSSSTQDSLLGHFYSRRMLLPRIHSPLYPSPAMATPPPPVSHNLSFDANHVMVLSVLLCAIICSLAIGLHSIIRCALRLTAASQTQTTNNPSAIGLANAAGINKKVLTTFPTLTYSDALNQQPAGLDTACVICLSEFTHSDHLRILPKCNHGFHVQCIDKWLNSHSSCPTCRHCLIELSHQIQSCAPPNSSQSLPPPSPLETILRIVPLEPEGLIRNHQDVKIYLAK